MTQSQAVDFMYNIIVAEFNTDRNEAKRRSAEMMRTVVNGFGKPAVCFLHSGHTLKLKRKPLDDRYDHLDVFDVEVSSQPAYTTGVDPYPLTEENNNKNLLLLNN